MTEFKLGRPSTIKIISYLLNSGIYIINLILTIIFSNEFTKDDNLLERLVTYLVIDGIIFFLSTYQLLIRIINRNMVFNNIQNLIRWKEKYFFTRTLIIFNFISIIIRLSFTQLIWNPPAGFNLNKLNLFTVIFIVNIHICLTIIGVTLIMFLSFCFIYTSRRFTILRRINRVSALNTIFQITNNDSNDNCAICLDNSNIRWIQLNCNHKFHESCMIEYITSSQYNPTCPLCRAIIIQNIEFQEMV